MPRAVQRGLRQVPARLVSVKAELPPFPRFSAGEHHHPRIKQQAAREASPVSRSSETTEKGQLPGGHFLSRPGGLASFRPPVGWCYAAWARRAAAIGWRLTRTAVQTAWSVDLRFPR